MDSIRTFDVESQRSIENMTEITIYPAVNFRRRRREGGVSFLDYFSKEDTILFLDEPVRLVERGQNIEEEFLEAQKKASGERYELEEEEAKIFLGCRYPEEDQYLSSIGIFCVRDESAGDWK